MKTSKLKTKIIYFILLFICFPAAVMADGDGYGGTQSPFIHGVGARALSLGNAYVAIPSDASAIYWNPAGLDHNRFKNFMMFYTNLIVSQDKLYYLGYVHPTTSFGSFGIGIFGLDIGGIPFRDENAVYYGDKTSSEQQYFFSYGKQLPWHLTAGISLKIHHQNIVDFKTTGLGADVGFLYHPDFTHPILSGLSVGMTIQNLIGPRLKAGPSTTDILPLNVRLGLAKPILVNEWGSQFTFFMDLEKGDERSPLKFHAGTEYVFQNLAMLRVGMNNTELAFGAGAAFKNIQIDYSYGKFASHELSPSHRISVSVKMGKSKDELIQIAKNERFQEIRSEVAKELNWEREKKIDEAMEYGRQYLQADDFARATREFNFVMKFESELPEDPRIDEAKQLADEAMTRSKNELERSVKESQAKTEKERLESEKQGRLNQLFLQGMAYYESDDYDKAIAEWQRMLEIDPNNSLAQEHVASAQAELDKKLLRLINQADNLAKEGNYYAALRILNNARNLNPDQKKIILIDQKENQYSNQLNFDDLYREGYGYYLQKDYARAMASFEKALGIDPKNADVNKLFFAAKQRANAKKEPLAGIHKQKFDQARDLYRDGKYQEALSIFQDIEKEKPYNKYVLDFIDMAQEKIEQQKHRPNQP